MESYQTNWNDVFYRVYFCNENDPIKIVTLGPQDTSSENAAQKLKSYFGIKDSIVILKDTFEEAKEEVIKGDADLLLVANAYSNISKFYMPTSGLKLFTWFQYNTPPYAIAGINTKIVQTKEPLIIHSHPAPVSMISSLIPGSNYKVVTHSSTSRAAIEASRNAKSYCLANLNAIKSLGLNVLTELKEIEMLWTIFHSNKFIV